MSFVCLIFIYSPLLHCWIIASRLCTWNLTDSLVSKDQSNPGAEVCIVDCVEKNPKYLIVNLISLVCRSLLPGLAVCVTEVTGEKKTNSYSMIGDEPDRQLLCDMTLKRLICWTRDREIDTIKKQKTKTSTKFRQKNLSTSHLHTPPLSLSQLVQCSNQSLRRTAPGNHCYS